MHIQFWADMSSLCLSPPGGMQASFQPKVLWLLHHEAESRLTNLFPVLLGCTTGVLLWLWSFGDFEAWAIWLNLSAFGLTDLALIVIIYICSSPLVLTIGLDLRLCFHSYNCAFLKCPSACDNPCVNAVISVKRNVLWYNFKRKRRSQLGTQNCTSYSCLSKNHLCNKSLLLSQIRIFAVVGPSLKTVMWSFLSVS